MRTNEQFERDVARNLEGCEAVSTGLCPGCEQCLSDYGDGMTMEEFEEAWSSGKVDAEPWFSWHACDACGSTLGGNREPLHWLDADKTIMHGSACTDCVLYLANGDLPNGEIA